jgi:hypothetical protein
MAQSEGAAWRKFLKPLVGATIVMMGAVGGYFEYMQRQNNSAFRDEVTALKIRMEAAEKRSDKFDVEIDGFKVLLSDIRSDVSFIRGKMEGGK